MKKDIERPEVTDVGVAMVLEQEQEGIEEWSAYLINMKQEPLLGVLVSSRGYGELDGEERKTSVLRQFLGTLGAHQSKRIESVLPEVFTFNNEYLVSFKQGGIMYDKRYTFTPNSIALDALVTLPVIGKRGLMLL